VPTADVVINDVRLVVDTRSAAVSGRVVVCEGRPMAGALVMAAERNGPLGCASFDAAGVPRAGPDGQFTFANLPLGTTTVITAMSCAGHWTQARDIAPGRDDLVLAICGPSVLEGTVTGLGPSPSIQVDAIGFRHTTTAADGRFRVTGLPPGVATVTGFGDGFAVERVEVQKVTRVELRGSSGHVIASVLGPMGTPREGVSCSWWMGPNLSSGQRTDAKGIARFVVPAGQRISINCSDPAERSQGWTATTVSAGATVEIEIAMRRY
jgi:hypothetical protein